MFDFKNWVVIDKKMQILRKLESESIFIPILDYLKIHKPEKSLDVFESLRRPSIPDQFHALLDAHFALQAAANAMQSGTVVTDPVEAEG